MYKKYDKYKDSGVVGIEQIPAHWNIRRLATLGKFSKGFGISKSDISEFGEPAILYGDIYTKYCIRTTTFQNYISTETAKYAKKIRCNTLLLTGSGETKEDIGKCIVYRGAKSAYAGGDIILFEPSETNSLLLSYILNSEYVKAQKYAIARGDIIVHIYASALRELTLALPPLPEQQAIANFLEHKTKLIDNITSNRRRQIELLKEERKAVINRAVTKGINPDVKYKDSGVEWLGDIPEHWEVVKLKNIASIKNGRDHKHVYDENGKYPIYGSGGVFGRANEYLYEKTSVLLGRKGTIDKPILVTEPFWTVDTAFYTEISQQVLPTIFYYLCKQIDFGKYVYGSALPSMTQKDLKEIHFALPTIKEQLEIVNYIEERTNIIDKLISKYEKQIELLEEYKTVLISNAVTGQIDVRDWKAKRMEYEDREESFGLDIAAEDSVEYEK